MPDSQLPTDHAELILLYQSSVSEIAGFKQQQWSATYYVLIAQAAIVAVGQAIAALESIDRFVLGVLLVLSLAFGFAVLRALHASIECRRTRLADTRSHFGEPFKNARASSKEPEPVPAILAAGQSIGALVAGWLVVVRL